ncbi:4-hydroxythreonine-4-phosphate dehydrogenase [Streptomyces spongiae]|uniref:4-hydroxythreonine-4-phosphate dehydrogenase n=1 Tax=Streptomyces spongiae TaxID=565072 RepID=A0A5N8XK10_9ACTN|nr:4-hydroxythreonine-4-phosphate dehydrogenase [Streptomyces spongiae]
MLALADDLSGAAETAMALRLPSRIVLGAPAGGLRAEGGSVALPAAGECVVVDLDSRQLPANDAARSVQSAVAAGAFHGGLLFKKVDSLLRGNLAAETVAYAAGARGVVIAPALPVAGRTVCGGVVHLRGVPLHATDAWRAEGRPPPRSVSHALRGVPTALVPLPVVRGGALADHLSARFAQGRHPVCDAETDEDLNLIAAAAHELGPDVRMLGTGGLASAVGRLLAPTPDPTLPRPRGTTERPLLVVVGTAEPTATQQIEQLTAVGARHMPLSPGELTRAPTGRLDITPIGITVVSLTGPVSPAASRELVATLASAVADVAGGSDLVLTGGETARRVLDALHITQLRPVAQIHHGAIHSRTPDGRCVVTRPGSFGEADSLLRIARALRPETPHPDSVHPESVHPAPSSLRGEAP